MGNFKNREIPNEVLSNLKYDEASPTCLVWVSGCKKGKYAGCIPTREDTPYVKVMVRGVVYQAHRIVWTMFNGPIPKDMVIDHLDRNPSNNNIKNLCLKTASENFRNRKKSKKNTSGSTGVHSSKNRQGRVYAYKALWMEGGKQCSKHFNIEAFGGSDKARESAEIFRVMKIKELSNKGYGYTETHGEPRFSVETCPECGGCGIQTFNFDMNKRIFN